TVALTFAALADHQNFDLSATIGPLINNGVIDIDAIPLTGMAKVGPIELAQLATIPMLANSIPPKLSISGPFSLNATADGTVQSIKFNVSSDFSKPAGQPLKMSAEGTRTDSAMGLMTANVTLGGLEAKAANIKVGGGTTAARVDTNDFDIASLSKMIAALGKYNFEGRTEIHTDAALANGKVSATGMVALADVGLSNADQKAPPVSRLSGSIKLKGTSADVGPLTFNLGAAQATLKSHVDQFQPLVMSYELNASSVRLADLALSRPPDEMINQLFAKGAAKIVPVTGLVADSQITSPSGNLANVPYQNLDLS